MPQEVDVKPEGPDGPEEYNDANVPPMRLPVVSRHVSATDALLALGHMSDYAKVEGAAKPLHVQVAEALGWKRPSEEGRCDVCGWRIVPHPQPGCWADNCSMRWEGPRPPRADEPARYDTDWSATGPLIEKYNIGIRPIGSQWEAMSPWRHLEAPTALLAVCNLLIALGKAGKL